MSIAFLLNTQGLLQYSKLPFVLSGSKWRSQLECLGKGRIAEYMNLSAYAEDHACVPKRLHAQSVAVKAGTPTCRHGLRPWMNAKRITLGSLVRRRVCFGGFRRRTWRYHGLCPWGSIVNSKLILELMIAKENKQKKGRAKQPCLLADLTCGK
jgi:hypothetical protein